MSNSLYVCTHAVTVGFTEYNIRGYARSTVTATVAVISGRLQSYAPISYITQDGTAQGNTLCNLCMRMHANLMNHNICTENFDYYRFNGYISLTPHKTSRNISVWITSKATEGQTFYLRLSSSSYRARIDPNAQTIRITIIGKLDNTCIRT